jgi:5-methylcytosine-specific restriction endonuclease McrA
MLREIAWFFLPITPCYFCKKPLIEEPPFGSTFGHRRHPPIEGKVTFHHVKHDRAMNRRWTDVVLAHQSCHRKYHAEVNRGDRSKPEPTNS